MEQVHDGSQNEVQLSTHNCFSPGVNPALSYFIMIYVKGTSLHLMVDTNAVVSLLGKDMWSLLGGTSKYTLQQWSGSWLVGV